MGARADRARTLVPSDGSSGSDVLVLGLLADPDLPVDIARELAEELPDLLAERISNRVDWRIPVVLEDLGAGAGGGVEMIDHARSRMLDEGWDLAICLTDLPLRIDRRPVVAYASAAHGVGVVSLPALGPLQMGRRAREAILRLVDGLVGESLELGRGGDGGERRRRRVGRRLSELAAPIRRIEGEDDGDVRLVASVVRGHLRLLLGMVRANRPWRLVLGLSRLLVVALSSGALTLMNNTVWGIADALDPPRLALMALVSTAALAAWLIVNHHLWERGFDRPTRERAVLFNTVTTLTVTIGVLSLYAALFVLTFLGATVFIDDSVIQQTVQHPVGVGDVVKLALVASSAATVGGALGASLESDSAVRQAAYGYHPDRHAERDARDARRGARDAGEPQ
jgi:hypothetical protein